MASNQTFNIQVMGLDELVAKFNKAPEVIRPILSQALEKSKVVLDNHRIDPSNVPMKSGELARRWSTSYGELSLTTKPDVLYARAVQFGMPPSPGRYVPAIGKRLIPSGRGMWPGFAGRHFMEKIRSASIEEINTIFRNAVQAAKEALS